MAEEEVKNVQDTPEPVAEAIVEPVAETAQKAPEPQPQTAPPRQQRYGGNNNRQGAYPRRPRGPRPDQEEKQFDERVVYVNRVARVVKGGRRFRFQALLVIGDHKGKVGIGVAKGADVAAAVNKATDSAKKNITNIPLHYNTLTHDVEAKVGGAKILIKPAAPGTGLIAGGVVRTVLEVAGIENALSKSHGSTNRINMAYAALEALKQMVPASEWVTRRNISKPAVKKPAKAEAKS